VRAEGAGSRSHGLVDLSVRVALEVLGAEDAEHDALLVDHHTGVPALEPLVDVAYTFLEPARRGVGTRELPCADHVRVLTFNL
jgi:hypothetical protein